MAESTTVIATEDLSLEALIPDFVLERSIGGGAFGEVYLARSKATGRYRAIKVVRRARFHSDHPYDIEFAGLRRFEEVSREHQGFVDILHVSRSDQAGCFSYVMELADELEPTSPFNPSRYVPRTLANLITRAGGLPAPECVRIAQSLASTLEALHSRSLVHRDVNPRNIIFVRGAPKLADVGLVADAHGESKTLVGTPDYMDPELQGTPGGDLYSLGKVIFTMTTGLPPRHWPDAPAFLGDGPDGPIALELEAIWKRACHPVRSRRYQTAADMGRELLALQAGASVLRFKQYERTIALIRRYAVLLAAVAASLAVTPYFLYRQEQQAADLRQRRIGAFVAQGDHALDTADYLGALCWFGEAWRLDDRVEHETIHRLRLGSILQRSPQIVQMWSHTREDKEAYFPSEDNQVVLSNPEGRW